MNDTRFDLADVVADFFREAAGIPDAEIPALVNRCSAGSSWPDWAAVANEWLREHGRSEVLVKGMPAPAPEHPAIDTLEALLQWAQDQRAYLLGCDEDNPVNKLVAQSIAPCALRVIRSWGATVLPDMPDKPATIGEAQRGLDQLMAWCDAHIAAGARQNEESEMGFHTLFPAKKPAVDGAGRDKNATRQNEQPAEYLFSWLEILDCLNLPNDEETRRRVSRLNQEHNGPIIVTGKGGQPKVEKSKLIEWWNRLEILWKDRANQEAGKKMSGEAQHNYGASGTAAPEVGGGVKKRRRDRKP